MRKLSNQEFDDIIETIINSLRISLYGRNIEHTEKDLEILKTDLTFSLCDVSDSLDDFILQLEQEGRSDSPG